MKKTIHLWHWLFFQFYIVISSYLLLGTKANDINISISFELNTYPSSKVPFLHNWETTGWCPPAPETMFDYALEESSWQNHAFIKSIPNSGIRFVRIHDLLFLLTVPSGTDPSITPPLPPSTYNFTELDAVLDMIVGQFDLMIGFEIMGNPRFARIDESEIVGSPYLYTDWSDKNQIESWKVMVHTIATRYISRYGINIVSQWRWEAWNEPDHACNHEKKMKAGIDCDLNSWLQYYDACAQGLMEAHPSLLWGGPGTGGATLKTDFLPALLKHVANETRVASITGRHATTKLDFIQWHAKGALKIGSKPSNTAYDLQIAELAKATTPSLVTGDNAIPLGNEEVDPMGGWNKVATWRGDAMYPAAAARILNMHQYAIVENKSLGVRYTYHSNDNAFLNYGNRWFDQRTLVVRFLMNETKPPTVEVIRKPIINFMGLLSLLGDYKLTGSAIKGIQDPIISPIGVIGTTREYSQYYSESNYLQKSSSRWEAAVLLYNSNGTFDCVSSCNATINLKLKDLPSTDVTGSQAMLVHYRIDQENGNPRAQWTEMGGSANPYPTAEQFAILRKNSKLTVLNRFPIQDNKKTFITMHLPQPAVSLLHICSPPLLSNHSIAPPQKVKNLLLHNTSIMVPVTVFVMWEDIPERCILTYEVEYSPTKTRPHWHRVNDDTIFSAFVHVQVAKVSMSGCYRVRAINYWNISGPFSEVVCIY